MKGLKIFIMSVIIGSILVSCSDSTNKSNESANKNSDVTTTQDNNAEEKGEVEKNLTSKELNDELKKQPILLLSTKYMVQDPQLKALYPDLLNTVIKNKSGADIKNVSIGFAAWDKNNFPVKILNQYGQGDYFIKGDYEDTNMINGATYGEGMGMPVDEKCNISKFKAIVVSYTDFDGNTWDNPLLDDFIDLYCNKKLVE